MRNKGAVATECSKFTPNKSLKVVASPLDSPNRRMLRIVCADWGCPLALRYAQ
jgi:hypothetical protein